MHDIERAQRAVFSVQNDLYNAWRLALGEQPNEDLVVLLTLTSDDHPASIAVMVRETALKDLRLLLGIGPACDVLQEPAGSEAVWVAVYSPHFAVTTRMRKNPSN